MRGNYTTYTPSVIADPKTGKLKPPGRGAVSTWCKASWAETVNTCFKICGLTLVLDGSEDHAWYTHNVGEGYRELLQQQRVEWEAAHPDVTLPPLQLPEVPVTSGTNAITAPEKELETKLLPPSGDGESDSDVELVDGSGGGGAEGKEVVEL